MAFGARHSRALVLGASAFSFAMMWSSAAFTQTLEAEAVTRPAEQKKQKQAKRKPAKPQQDTQAAAPVMNARAQIGAAPVQSLDTITVAASKTEERAIDALAPVSVVTLEQIQGRQASTLGGLLYNIPGVWVQDRGDEPSTSINIRGLQDFGRVAVVVDGARQNYQRTGHFANGSFFLNPELVGGIDIVRGPTANIYGSGAIGGVASFRTKDIEDVVRPGERWGVDAKTILGTNYGRALGSVFGGVHVNPNVDVFAGGTYSTQESYKDGTGFEVANTGNRLTAGIAKLTVRPADGHEVKLGTIFQEDLYSVGQPPRRAGDPNSTNANGTNNLNGTSIYRTDVKNYTTTLGWKYSQPDDKWFDWDAKVYWNRTENDQIKTGHTSTTPSAYCGGVPGNAISGCIGSNRGYQLDTIGVDVHNTTRFETYDWRHAVTYGLDAFQDKVATDDLRGTSDVTTPGGQAHGVRRVRAVEGQLHLDARSGRRVALRQLPAGIGDDVRRRRSPVAEDHGRSDAHGRADALCQLCRRLPCSVDHRNARQRSACRRYRQRLVLPLSVGYSGTRRRFDILLRSQSEPASRSRQEQGDRLQPEEERPVHVGRQRPRQVQRVPQRYHRFHRPGCVRHAARGSDRAAACSEHYRSAVPAVPERRLGQNSGLRGRDDVRRQPLVRRCRRHLPERQEPADGLWAVQRPAAEDHDDGRHSVAR